MIGQRYRDVYGWKKETRASLTYNKIRESDNSLNILTQICNSIPTIVCIEHQQDSVSGNQTTVRNCHILTITILPAGLNIDHLMLESKIQALTRTKIVNKSYLLILVNF